MCRFVEWGSGSQNGIIANLYQSSEALPTAVESVQNEIEKLQKVAIYPGDLYAANPDLLDQQQINEQLTVF